MENENFTTDYLEKPQSPFDLIAGSDYLKNQLVAHTQAAYWAVEMKRAQKILNTIMNRHDDVYEPIEAEAANLRDGSINEYMTGRVHRNEEQEAWAREWDTDMREHLKQISEAAELVTRYAGYVSNLMAPLETMEDTKND